MTDLERIVLDFRRPAAVKDGTKQFWDKWMGGGGEVQIKEITDQFNKWIAAHPEWKDPKATFAPETWNTKWTYHPRPKKA
jgi:hypothetical protein